MAQTLTRELTRDFNPAGVNREIKTAFPAKFVQGDATFPGYVVDETQFTTGSTVVGRIVTPAGSSVVIATSNGVPTDTAANGEIRMFFDPDLTAPQITNLDANVLVDHVVTDTTPKQVAEDLDITTLDDLETFEAGGAFNTLTNLQQNDWVGALTRQVLRIWERLEAAE